ncbi:MAG: hypothetical protein LBG58_07235 [Planctomycetaceae bacterium]|nr:hypothetical protein [Planctomycetaceae bacterium]
MRKKVYSENHWSELGSQLGIDNSNAPDSEEISEQISEISDQDQSQPLTELTEVNNSSDMVRETAFYPESDSFGEGFLENVAEEVPPSTKNYDQKKRFFERFPKINLLGTFAKESLQTVAENVESPSSNGKTFTSNKLEKIPAVSDDAARSETATEETVRNETMSAEAVPDKTVPDIKRLDRFDTEKVFSDIEESPEKIICTEKHTQAIVDLLDPWSKIASQVGVLSLSPSERNQEEPELSADWLEEIAVTVDIDNDGKDLEQPVRSNRDFNKRSRHHAQRRSQRSLPSMFDEPTPESEESAALKNLMESEHYDNDAEKRLRSIFSEEEKTERAVSSEATPQNQPSNDSGKQHGKYYGNVDHYSKNPKYPKNPRYSKYPENQTETFSPRSDREEESFKVKESFTLNDGEKRFDRTESEERPRELVRERGRRGARFEPRERQQEQLAAKNNSRSEDIETTWDIEEESKPVERSPHKHRRGKNWENNTPSKEHRTSSEKTTDIIDTKLTANEEMEIIQLHKNIPSWDEAIDQLVEYNIARHLQASSSSSRNSGGRR